MLSVCYDEAPREIVSADIERAGFSPLFLGVLVYVLCEYYPSMQEGCKAKALKLSRFPCATKLPLA